MPPRNIHTGTLIASAALLLAGCATTGRDAPPEATAQAPVVLRHRPTDQSIEEIRSQNAAAAPPQNLAQRVDRAHDRTYVWAQELVEATDHQFAAKDAALQPVPAAPFRLGLLAETLDRNDGLKLSLNADFEVALKLPNIEKRLGLFVTSDDLDEAPTGTRDQSSLSAGLRYEVLRFLDLDVGVKVNVPPVAFTSVKWAREYRLGRWDFYPFAKLFVDTDEGLGFASAATFDRWFGRNVLRSSTYAKWRADSNRTEWTQSFAYARVRELIVPERYGSYLKGRDIGRGWGVHMLAGGDDTNEVSHYEAGIFYRRPSKNRWLYWFVEPLVSWDRKYSWSGDAGIRIGIDALFWDLAGSAKP